MFKEKLNTKEFLDEITDLVQSVAPDGTFLYTNRAWHETLGYTDREVRKLKMFDIIHPDSLDHCREMFRRVMGGERLMHVEAKFVAKKVSVIVVDGNSSVHFKHGKPYATRSIFRDITGRRQAEAALRDSEALFREFMDNSPTVAFMKDEQGRYVYANRRREGMFGIKIENLIGKTNFDWLPKEVAQALQKHDQRVLSLWQKSEALQTVPMPDGATRFWLVLKFPFEHSDGRKFVGGVAIDVTKRREAEEKLRRSEREIKTLIEHSNEIIARLDRALRFVFVNPALERVTGIARDYYIGKTMAEAGIPEETRRFFETRFWHVLESGEEKIVEYQMPMLFGSIYMQCRLTPEQSDDGETIGSLLIVARDITERREMEERLRLSEQHYRHLVEDSQGLICTHDLRGNLLSVNLAAQVSLGYTASEVVGRNLREFISPAKQHKFDDYLKDIRKNATASGLMRVVAKDGGERVWKYHNVKLSESVVKPLILGHAQDVTEMTEMQKHLENQSLTDDLTGLYNRRGFLLLAERRIRLARAEGKETGVFIVFADVDGLKQINDCYGHDEGSLAIKKTGEILASCFRGSDVISRLGGDEFVVLVVDERIETQEIVVRRIEEKVRCYNTQKNHKFDLSLSVGITSVDLHSQVSIEELLRQADQRMYEQKRNKKNV